MGEDAPTPRGRRGEQTRERILEAAAELIYAEGIRAVSADRIIERAGITKVTFYRHFPTKSDLVVAYLAVQSAAEQQWFRGRRRPGDPAGTLRALAEDIGVHSCRPGFRGCAFINAAAEFADPSDPVRVAVGRHRAWMLEEFADIAAEAGATDVARTAEQLMMLRDGAMVGGYLGAPDQVAGALQDAFDSVLADIARRAGLPSPA